MALIDEQIQENQSQLDKLLDLNLTGDFPKEMLTERKERLEQISANLLEEKSDLMEHISQATKTDDQMTYIEDFCTKIRERLDTITFEGKRRILEMLDVRGTLAIENDEKVIYLSCLIAPQPVSLALILPLLNTGAIATMSCASHPTARSQ